MTLQEAVEHDKEQGYWFPHGQTPLKGTDYVQPVSASSTHVLVKTGNFGHRIDITAEAYMCIRKHPKIKVGIWGFCSPDELYKEIRFAHSNPTAAGRRIAALRQTVERLEQEVERLRLESVSRTV